MAPSGATNRADEDSDWFASHYDAAAQEVIDFLRSDGISLERKRVADVGCGDGIIDLGLVHKARPASLTGFDILPIDRGELLHKARAAGINDDLPAQLEFVTSGVRTIPAEDRSFDIVVSWSTFEHVEDPVALASEIRRVLDPRGSLFLQLWPFYHSAHGSHLWTWFPEGWAQLREPPDVVEMRIAAEPERASKEWMDARLDDWRSLNFLTVDGLERALAEAGLRVVKAELLGGSAHLPTDVDGYRMVDLLIEGIKLLAVPWPPIPI